MCFRTVFRNPTPDIQWWAWVFLCLKTLNATMYLLWIQITRLIAKQWFGKDSDTDTTFWVRLAEGTVFVPPHQPLGQPSWDISSTASSWGQKVKRIMMIWCVPGTLNNHFLMDVWWNNQFLCNDLESSSWNNCLRKWVVWSSRLMCCVQILLIYYSLACQPSQ